MTMLAKICIPSINTNISLILWYWFYEILSFRSSLTRDEASCEISIKLRCPVKKKCRHCSLRNLIILLWWSFKRERMVLDKRYYWPGTDIGRNVIKQNSFLTYINLRCGYFMAYYNKYIIIIVRHVVLILQK